MFAVQLIDFIVESAKGSVSEKQELTAVLFAKYFQNLADEIKSLKAESEIDERVDEFQQKYPNFDDMFKHMVAAYNAELEDIAERDELPINAIKKLIQGEVQLMIDEGVITKADFDEAVKKFTEVISAEEKLGKISKKDSVQTQLQQLAQ